MPDLKSSVSKIKPFMTQDELADPSDTGIDHSASATTTSKKNMHENQIRGNPESKNDDARCWQEHNFKKIQEVLDDINVQTGLSDVTRLGKYDTNETRTILLEVPDPYLEKTQILLSAYLRLG